jgi:hypothetical protein
MTRKKGETPAHESKVCHGTPNGHLSRMRSIPPTAGVLARFDTVEQARAAITHLEHCAAPPRKAGDVVRSALSGAIGGIVVGLMLVTSAIALFTDMRDELGVQVILVVASGILGSILGVADTIERTAVSSAASLRTSWIGRDGAAWLAIARPTATTFGALRELGAREIAVPASPSVDGPQSRTSRRSAA